VVEERERNNVTRHKQGRREGRTKRKRGKHRNIWIKGERHGDEAWKGR